MEEGAGKRNHRTGPPLNGLEPPHLTRRPRRPRFLKSLNSHQRGKIIKDIAACSYLIKILKIGEKKLSLWKMYDLFSGSDI